MFRFFIACTMLTVCTVAQAQTQPKASKPTSPGEMSAIDLDKNEKRATCTREAKEKKLKLLERRKFIKACVNK